MPYINQMSRKYLAGSPPNIGTPGELNYSITMAIKNYLRTTGGGMPNGYNEFNAAMGALECAKQEFYRRIMIPYEDKKRKENGDVY